MHTALICELFLCENHAQTSSTCRNREVILNSALFREDIYPKPAQEMCSNALDQDCNVSNTLLENSQIHPQTKEHQT